MSEGEIVGVWEARAPRLEIVSKSDTLSVDLDQFLVKFFPKMDRELRISCDFRCKFQNFQGEHAPEPSS